MTPTETERFDLRQGLSNVLEEGPVRTLMDSLPPVDWRELATKTDLVALEERINVKFEVVDVRLEALRSELGAKIDMVLTGLNAKIDTGLTDLNAKIDTGLTDLDAKIDKRAAQQIYVVLVGMAAMMTPIYLALFTGGAG